MGSAGCFLIMMCNHSTVQEHLSISSTLAEDKKTRQDWACLTVTVVMTMINDDLFLSSFAVSKESLGFAVVTSIYIVCAYSDVCAGAIQGDGATLPPRKG